MKISDLHGVYDVVVCGAGPSGFVAAIAAARRGQRVMLIDRAGFPGGEAVNCCPYYLGFGISDIQVVHGITDEFIRELDRHDWARRLIGETGLPDTERIGNRELQNVVISEDGARVTINRMLDRAGVEKLFYTSVVDVESSGREITSVIVDCCEGFLRIRGRKFIDATGDAALAFRAGAECRKAEGDEAMTKTIFIRVNNVRDFIKPRVAAQFKEQVERGNPPFFNQDVFMGIGMLNPGEVLLNLTLAVGDALSVRDLTRMEQELREQIFTGIDWFRRSIPGFEECRLVGSATRLGIRAGRGGVGRATITTHDLDEGTPVNDPVAWSSRSYGGHNLNAFFSDWRRSTPGKRGIPMGCLISKDFDNLLFAGRAISAEAKTLSSFRLMPRCGAIGEAAGIMASAGDLDYAKIKNDLPL